MSPVRLVGLSVRAIPRWVRGTGTDFFCRAAANDGENGLPRAAVEVATRPTRLAFSPCLLGLEKLKRHATCATSFVFFAGFVVNTTRGQRGFREPFHHEAREEHEEPVLRCRQRDPAYRSQNLPLETTTSNHLRKSVPAPVGTGRGPAVLPRWARDGKLPNTLGPGGNGWPAPAGLPAARGSPTAS